MRYSNASRRKVLFLTLSVMVAAFTPLLGGATSSVASTLSPQAAGCLPQSVVTNNGDSGAGSLRDAIMATCDGGTITFATTVVSPITLARDLVIDQSLTIQGPGASVLTISGDHAVRVFTIGNFNKPDINVTLSGLTIANGRARSGDPREGGGIFFFGSGTLTIASSTLSGNSVSGTIQGFGGGIFNNDKGTVNVTNSVLSGNSASSIPGPSGSGSDGGAIFNGGRGTVNVTNSTLSGNSANGGGGLGLGGGIYNNDGGTVNVTNSTVSGNTASGNAAFGGGINNAGPGTLTVTNSTISGNTASSSGTSGVGGGIHRGAGAVVLKNTIITGNTVTGGTSAQGPDVNGAFISKGYNLIGKNDFSTGLTDSVNHDQVGTIAKPLDPRLDPGGLRNNGGPTPTIALLPDSPAIDQGSAANDPATSNPITTDQRGFVRPADDPSTPNAKGGNGSDVGAYEFGAQASTCIPPPNTTMVAWYPFDEATGTLSANLATGNTGVRINGPTSIPGMVAGALNFNGVDQYVESPSSIVTNIGPADFPDFCSGGYSSCRGDFSIDTWIRIDPSLPGSGVLTILDKRSGSPPTIKGYHFFLFFDGSEESLGLQLADGLGSGFSNYLSPDLTPALTDGVWHHIAVTVRRTKHTGIRWYHNGVLFGSSDPTDRLGSLENNSPLRIGTRTAAPPLSGWFPGDLDEFEIYNRALTPQEVASIFNAGTFGKCK